MKTYETHYVVKSCSYFISPRLFPVYGMISMGFTDKAALIAMLINISIWIYMCD